jgi:hypothetical protein
LWVLPPNAPATSIVNGPALGVKTDGASDACALEPLCESCENVAEPPMVARAQSIRNAGVIDAPVA